MLNGPKVCEKNDPIMHFRISLHPHDVNTIRTKQHIFRHYIAQTSSKRLLDLL